MRVADQVMGVRITEGPYPMAQLVKDGREFSFPVGRVRRVSTETRVTVSTRTPGAVSDHDNSRFGLPVRVQRERPHDVR